MRGWFGRCSSQGTGYSQRYVLDVGVDLRMMVSSGCVLEARRSNACVASLCARHCPSGHLGVCVRRVIISIAGWSLPSSTDARGVGIASERPGREEGSPLNAPDSEIAALGTCAVSFAPCLGLGGKHMSRRFGVVGPPEGCGHVTCSPRARALGRASNITFLTQGGGSAAHWSVV